MQQRLIHWPDNGEPYPLYSADTVQAMAHIWYEMPQAGFMPDSTGCWKRPADEVNNQFAPLFTNACVIGHSSVTKVSKVLVFQHHLQHLATKTGCPVDIVWNWQELWRYRGTFPIAFIGSRLDEVENGPLEGLLVAERQTLSLLPEIGSELEKSGFQIQLAFC